MLNAIFACAEIAVISVNETRLENLAEQGNKNAKKILGGKIIRYFFFSVREGYDAHKKLLHI